MKLDSSDYRAYEEAVQQFDPDMVIHLAALLSGSSERDIVRSTKVNILTLSNSFDLCHRRNIQIFVPSSIAVFNFPTGRNRENIGEDVITSQSSFYGISKQFMEQLGDHLAKKGLDFRSLRYPGVLSPIMPEGGTTDFAIQMLYAFVRGESYESFVDLDVGLPFVYIDDLILQTLHYLECDRSLLKRNVYNFGNFAFSGKKLFEYLN